MGAGAKGSVPQLRLLEVVGCLEGAVALVWSRSQECSGFTVRSQARTLSTH